MYKEAIIKLLDKFEEDNILLKQIYAVLYGRSRGKEKLHDAEPDNMDQERDQQRIIDK